MSFSRKDKFNSDRNFVRVEFGKEKFLLETELNEMQKIFIQQIRNSNKILFKDGFVGIKNVSYANNVFKFLADYYIQDGLVFPLGTELSLNVVNTGVEYDIYFEVKEKTVSHADKIPNKGNLNLNELISISDILDSEMENVEETSRRIQLQYDLLLAPKKSNYKSDGYLVANISSNGTLTQIAEEQLWQQESQAVSSVAGKTGEVTLTKNDVGLSNVDNTKDVDKVISKNTQFALDAKANLNSPALTGNPTAPTQIEGDNTTKLATTAFVQKAVQNVSSNMPKITADQVILNESGDTLVNHLNTNASTSVKGHVQLNNTLTSTSTTQGATANTVKMLNDKINNLPTTTELQNHINDYMPHDNNLNQYSLDMDTNNIYRTVEYKRADNTLYMKSTLSNPNVSGQYQTMVWQFYATNGTTIALTKTWTMVYDTNGKIISKVVS